jgi:hypothetical protein
MNRDYDIIGAEFFTDIDKSKIDEIITLGSYNKELVFGSNVWSRALQNYLILTHKPEMVKYKEMSELKLLVSRYYWFKKFYHGYYQANGVDAGIEQQISMLIETIGNTIKDFDWNELQKIDQLIENQI